ncbi:MAG: DUF3060 domain-containing protein [Deltaproteobacteria bacterium]|nr:MAG: DUF3060 domain-containing protein [Deltaproteobacteria bacterium]
MRHLTVALGLFALCFSGTALAGERAGFTVDKAAQTVSHDCSDGESVVVNGAQNTVTLTGNCGGVTVNGAYNKVSIAHVPDLTVNGQSNTVDVDAVAKVSMSGANNTVTWKKAIDETKKAPAVTKSGMGNTVKKAEAEE